MRIARPLATAMLLLGATACQERGGSDVPIIKAVRDNDAEAVAAYLAEGGDPNLRSRGGDPLLFIASGPKGGIAVAARLIEAGADLDVLSADARTPLMNALGWCDVDMARLLIAAGASLERVEGSRATAMESVCAGPTNRREETLALVRRASENGG